MSENNKNIERLMKAILTLKTPKECLAFFEDICTIKELHDIAQRLEIAELLNAGSNYQEIVQKTTASTATICRVNKCLNYGDGGYKTVINRLNRKEK